uniref:Putative secreted protein n=1 Tax=Amblyomma tuberculatum TaxID=48802 RepID=A0A6M2E498_9ACAR
MSVWLHNCGLWLYLLLVVQAITPGPMYSTIADIYQYQDPSEILESGSVLALYRTSKSWSARATLCMKSVSLSKEGNSFFRTIEYYRITPQRRTIWQYINITFNVTPIVTTNAQPFLDVEPDGDQDLPEAARNWLTFKNVDDTRVLFADERCLLMGTYIPKGNTCGYLEKQNKKYY